MVLKPEQVTVIVDTREQAPYDLSPMGAVPETLATGDYSVRGLEDLVCLERKSLEDLLGCIGHGRARFMRELQRMRAYPSRAVVIEAAWADLEAGNYRSRIAPKAACHSVLSWMTRYAVPFMFAGNREAGEQAARCFLFASARHRWEQLQGLGPGLHVHAGGMNCEARSRGNAAPAP